MRRADVEWALARGILLALPTLLYPLGHEVVRRLPGLVGDAAQTLLTLPVVPGYLVFFCLHWMLGLERPESLELVTWTVKGLVGVGGLNLLLYTFVLLLRDRWRPQDQPTAAVGITRRQVLGRAILLGTASAGAWAVMEPSWVEWTSHRLVLPGLPPRLHGWRIALVTDIHRGGYNTMDYLSRVARDLNAQRPDLVLLPGDFVFGSPQYFGEAAEFVAMLQSRVAPLGTLGNHDHWEGEAEGRRQLTAGGLHLLDNGRLFLDEKGDLAAEPPRMGLCLAGVGDLWEGRPDLGAALRGVPETMPRLVMSHNPDFAEEARGHGRVDAMLSGHTHGGQVRLPVAGALLLPSRYGQKYASGWCRGPEFPVYVSRGVGTTLLPVRFGARPEVALFELAPA